MNKRLLHAGAMSHANPLRAAVQRRRYARGETLVETLVGLLITALSLVMLSTAIATASRITAEQTIQMAQTYKQSTQDLMPVPTTASGDSGTVAITGTGIFSSVNTSATVTWKESDLPGSRTGITYALSAAASSEP